MSNQLGTCDGCFWWSARSQFSKDTPAFLCLHKAMGDEPDKFPDSGVFPDEPTSLYTLPKFGCVHWEDKDVRRLPRH